MSGISYAAMRCNIIILWDSEYFVCILVRSRHHADSFLVIMIINLHMRMFIAVLSRLYDTKLCAVKIIMDNNNTTLRGQRRGCRPWVRLQLNVKNECLKPVTPVWHTATGTNKVGAAYWGKFMLTSLKHLSVSLQNRLNKVLGELQN
jgi:hypothetical protein